MTPRKGIGRRKPSKSPVNKQGERSTIQTPSPAVEDSRPSRSNAAVVTYAEVDEYHEESKCNEAVVDLNRGVRISICVMLERLHDGVFKAGVAEDIRKRLGLGPRYSVHNVLKHYCLHRALGVKYTGDRIVELQLGRKPILDIDSVEAQILADNLEDGVSIGTCWHIINDHRQQSEKDSVTFSAVYGLLQRMKPQLQRIEEHRQGNADITSAGAKARFRWAVQLLVRYGAIDFDGACPDGLELLQGYYNDASTIPAYYDKSKLTMIDEYQQADWDEAHRQCTPGEGLGDLKRKHRLVFKRNAEGKVDMNGTFSERTLSRTNVKYNKEMRKAFGVAMVKKINGEGETVILGRRCRDFDYTEKGIKSIKDWNALEDKEIKRVKSLEGPGNVWTEHNREEGKVYLDDCITYIPGVGQNTLRILLEDEEPLSMVQELLLLDEERIQRMGERIVGLSVASLTKYVKYARDNIIEETAPRLVDHRKADNPYEARFGDTWKEEIAKSSSLLPFVCITKLIEHMVEATREVFVDTVYEDNFVFYHDALSLMTSNDTKRWMREKGYLKYWILPEQNLFHDDPDLVRYRGRPPGNCPELNSLDQSLNKDIHESVNRHIAITLSLENGDERKFSLNTPVKAKNAYRRIFRDVAPTMKRIIQDRRNIINSLKWIVNYQGGIIPDHVLRTDFASGAQIREALQLRNGHRYKTSQKAIGKDSKATWGGKRKRKLAFDDYGHKDWHPMVVPVVDGKMKISKYFNDMTDPKNKEEYEQTIQEMRFKKEYLER